MLVNNILLLELDSVISLITVFMYINNITKEAVINNKEISIVEITPFIIISSFKKNKGLGGIPANPITESTNTNFAKVKEL